jgi:hypothetical protein
MVAHVGYSVDGRSGGRVTPCAVYTVHVETRSTCFLIEPQKTRSTVCQWFSLKIDGSGFLVWASKLAAMVW